MKKSLKVVSILLAMVLGFSCMTTGAGAAYADYSSPAGYDALDHPYVSIAQCGSMLLDYVDEMLANAGSDLVGEIDAIFWSPVTYNFTSVDNALNSIVGIMNSGLVEDATGVLNLGDLERININAIRNSPRRNTVGRTDLEIVYALTQFLADNRNIIGRIVDSCWDNGGLAKYFLDINETVGDVHAKINEAMFKAFAEPLGYTIGQLTNVDTMLSYFVGNMLFGESGFLPSLPQALSDIGYDFTYSYSTDANGTYHFTTTFNLKNINVYQLLRGCLNAALLDFVKPALLDVFEDLDAEIKSMVCTLLNIDPALSTEEIVNGLIDLENGYLTTFIILDETGFYLTNDFYSLLTGVLNLARTLISGLSLYPNVETRDVSEIEDEGEIVAYLVRTVLVGLIDYADIPANVTTIREVVTYFLINYMADKMPEIDYHAMIASGQLNPKTDGALEVLADFGYYYLNATTTMDIPQGLSFEQTVAWVFNWAMTQWGGVLKTDNLTGTVWEKIDRLLWTNILDVTMLPNKYSNLPVGNITKTLLFDDFIYAILDWNLESVVAIFRSNTSPTASMNQSVNTFFITIIKRIINGMFQGNPANQSTLVMNNTITCFNDIAVDKSNTSDSNKTNLRVLVEKLIERLVVYDSNILTSILPLFARSLAKVDDSAYEIYAPDGTYFTDADLEAMLARHLPGDDQVVNYDDPGYVFIESEDFRPMYKWYNYKEVRQDAESLLKRYREGSAFNPVTDDDIANIAYRLDYYYNRLSVRDANASQLTKEIAKANNAYGHGEYGDVEGSDRFTLFTWVNYMKAYDFAQSVYVEYLNNYDGTLRQAKITYARQLLIKAQKMLKPFSGEADYSLLNYAIALSQAALAKHAIEPYYEQETVDNLIVYLNEALAIPPGLDIDAQPLIKEAYDNLWEAYDEGLNELPNIEKANNTMIFLDKVNKYVWGFKENIANDATFRTYLTVVGAGSLEVISTQNGRGTGTVVRLVNDDVIFKQYTVIIFGDVDGNSRADGTDANLLYALNADLIELSYLNEAQVNACDANNDGRIDIDDYNILVQAGLLKLKVDQRGVA